MVNQFAYCPRLFYLEWVRKEWADNDDTQCGDAAHGALARRGGRMPAPQSPNPPANTCEVRIESQDLGLVAIVDKVVHSDGGCSPVDTKKGKAPQHCDMWPGDAAQLGVQALLLESQGYQVPRIGVHYAGSAERRWREWDEKARLAARRLVAEARAVASSSEVPPPLVNSPKCSRCSLAPICLPEETLALQEEGAPAPRRIIAPDPDSGPVYVTEQGSAVGVTGERLTISQPGADRPASVRLLDVAHLCLVGHVQVSSEAVWALCRRGSPVVWLSYGGWLNALAQPPLSKNIDVRRAQFTADESHQLAAARAMIRGKILNQRTLLRRNAKESLATRDVQAMKELAGKVASAATVAHMMGHEGAAARIYFQSFHKVFRDKRIGAEFAAVGRTRRPPRCPVNATLSFCYGLLQKEVLAAIVGVGMDPYFGVLHTPRYGRPALALDLMEEFRPLIADGCTVQLFNNGEIGATDFVTSPLGVTLQARARKKCIAAFERRMLQEFEHPTYRYKVTYRRALNVQARMLAAYLMGDVDRYVPVTTR